MRLEKLIITNFRQYRYREFEFKTAPGHPDIHIIVANNGVGKTNMLNAIKWCLFEKEPHLSNASLASPRLNKSAAEEERAKGNKIGTMSVTLEFSQDGKLYRITRKEDFKLTDTTEEPLKPTRLLVQELVNNDWEQITSEDLALATMLKIVPEQIQEYIFFDGEQLLNYFDSDQKSKVRNGVKGLTQVSVLENIIKRIQNYQSLNITSKISTSGDKALEDAVKFYNSKKESFDTITEKLEQKKQDADFCAGKVKSLSDKIKGFERVKSTQEELERCEGILNDNSKLLEKNMSQKMLLVRKYYQIFAIWPAIKAYYLYLSELDKKGELPPKFDKSLLESMKASGHCLVCDRDLDEHGKSHIENLIEMLTVSTVTSNHLNKTLPVLTQAIQDMSHFGKEMKVIDDERALLITKKEEIEEQIHNLQEYLKQVPNADQVRQWTIERDDFQHKERDAHISVGKLEEEQRTAKLALDKAEDKKKALQNRNKQMGVLNKQDDFCNDSISILAETCNEILEECRVSLASLTMQFFKTFLWKQDTFERIEIKEDFEFCLYNDHNQQILGSCSAAEISLLALSFTLALQNDTKSDSMLYIDTPVGRVDEENRKNFMNVLMNIAKDKQVILTFTPSEYDINVRQVVGNDYSSYKVMTIEDGVNKIKE